jgi:hypothetical protein
MTGILPLAMQLYRIGDSGDTVNTAQLGIKLK